VSSRDENPHQAKLLEEIQKQMQNKLSTSPSTRLETNFQSRDEQSKSSRDSSRAFGMLDRSLNSLRDAVKDKVLSSRESAVNIHREYDSGEQRINGARPDVFQRNIKSTAQSYRTLNAAATKIQRAFREWRLKKFRKYKAKRAEGLERESQGHTPLKMNQDILNRKKSTERGSRKEIDGISSK